MKKLTTTQVPSVDIRKWNRQGLLRSGNAFSCRIPCLPIDVFQAWVRRNEDCVDISFAGSSLSGEFARSHRIQLTKQKCNYGNHRLWLVCPMQGCDARCEVLYLNGYFACRKCHNLAYPSQCEDERQRVLRQADKLRDKLKWQSGIAKPAGLKPVNMHLRTYMRHMHKYEERMAALIATYKPRVTIEVA